VWERYARKSAGLREGREGKIPIAERKKREKERKGLE